MSHVFAGPSDVARTNSWSVIRPAFTPYVRKYETLVSTPGKPLIAVQMSPVSFSSCVCGEWSVAIWLTRPSRRPWSR
jgi:hypothetical protein